MEEFPDFPAGHWYMTDKARFSLTKTMTIYLRFYGGAIQTATKPDDLICSRGALYGFLRASPAVLPCHVDFAAYYVVHAERSSKSRRGCLRDHSRPRKSSSIFNTPGSSETVACVLQRVPFHSSLHKQKYSASHLRVASALLLAKFPPNRTVLTLSRSPGQSDWLGGGGGQPSGCSKSKNANLSPQLQDWKRPHSTPRAR